MTTVVSMRVTLWVELCQGRDVVWYGGRQFTTIRASLGSVGECCSGPSWTLPKAWGGREGVRGEGATIGGVDLGCRRTGAGAGAWG